jgi:hypothetical protein
MFLPVPYKIQRIIATDINRLSVDAMVALKCAAVLCVGGGQTSTEFDVSMLAVVYPHDGGRALSCKDLEAHLDTLVQVKNARECLCTRSMKSRMMNEHPLAGLPIRTLLSAQGSLACNIHLDLRCVCSSL